MQPFARLSTLGGWAFCLELGACATTEPVSASEVCRTFQQKAEAADCRLVKNWWRLCVEEIETTKCGASYAALVACHGKRKSELSCHDNGTWSVQGCEEAAKAWESCLYDQSVCNDPFSIESCIACCLLDMPEVDEERWQLWEDCRCKDPDGCGKTDCADECAGLADQAGFCDECVRGKCPSIVDERCKNSSSCRSYFTCEEACLP